MQLITKAELFNDHKTSICKYVLRSFIFDRVCEIAAADADVIPLFLSLQPPQVHNTHPRPTSLIHATPLHTDYCSLFNGCCVVNDSVNILKTNLYISK